MRRTAHLTYRAIGLLVEAGGWLAGLAVLVSLALVAWSVGLRYFLNQPEPWVDEAVGYVLVLCVMGAIADALRRGEHIAVDLLLTRLRPAMRRVLALWAAAATVIMPLVLIINGWGTAMLAHTLGLLTEGQLEWPTWWLMMLMPVGGVLLLLAALEALVRAWLGAQEARP